MAEKLKNPRLQKITAVNRGIPGGSPGEAEALEGDPEK